MGDSNAGNFVAYPANEMSGVDKEILGALVRNEEEMMREEQALHKEESWVQSSIVEGVRESPKDLVNDSPELKIAHQTQTNP